MKTKVHINSIAILILAFLLTATLKGRAADKTGSSATLLDYTSLMAGGKPKIESEKLNIEFNHSDSTSNVVAQYKGITAGVDVQKTYFLPGAGFDCNKNRTTINFANAFIHACSSVLGEDFVLVKSSSKKIPLKPLRAGFNGRWAILNGYKPVDYHEHANVYRALSEIEADFLADKKSKKPNLIGSSYGSVIAAQTAIALLERDNTIDSIGLLIISASMIAPSSELGSKLKSLEDQGKISSVYYHPNPSDNITACSGKSKKEAQQGFRKILLGTSPSITNMKKHEHNIAARDPKRATELLEILITRSPVTWVKES